MDDQFQYLAKTLSRTKRKDFENYCINRIWHQLNRTDIKPETQKYIYFNNGHHALIDLFFPAINLGVEIDEAHHHTQINDDKERTNQIINAFKTYHETDITIMRVDVTQNLNIAHQQIDDIVDEINRRINLVSDNRFLWLDMNPDRLINYLTEEGIISINDPLHFRTIKKTCELFDVYYDNMQQSYFKLKTNENYCMWFPKQAIFNDDHIQSASNKGWVNILAEDHKTIIEYNQDNKPINDPYTSKPRITFMQTIDPVTRLKQYEFIGVYQINPDDTNNNKRRRYHRIRTTFNLNEIKNYI